MSQRTAFPSPIADARVRADIAIVLRRRGVETIDLHDLVQETLTRALASRNPPQNFADCTLLTRAIARNVAVDYLRRRAVRYRYQASERYEEDSEGDLELPTTLDPIDRRRQLSLISREARSGRLSARAVAIVLAVSECVPHEEIAAELGVSRQTVKNELCRARRVFRSKWASHEASSAPRGVFRPSANWCGGAFRDLVAGRQHGAMRGGRISAALAETR